MSNRIKIFIIALTTLLAIIATANITYAHDAESHSGIVAACPPDRDEPGDTEGNGEGDTEGDGQGDTEGNEPYIPTLQNPLAGIGITTLIQFFSFLTNLLVFIVGIFAVISIIMGGYQMIT